MFPDPSRHVPLRQPTAFPGPVRVPPHTQPIGRPVFWPGPPCPFAPGNIIPRTGPSHSLRAAIPATSADGGGGGLAVSDLRGPGGGRGGLGGGRVEWIEE